MPISDWSTRDVLRYTAAIISLGAAGIHFSLTSEHFHQGLFWGVAFASLAWLQLAWAVVMGIKPSPKVALGGGIINIAGLAAIIGAMSSSAELKGSSAATTSAIFGAALIIAGFAMAKPNFLTMPVLSKTVLFTSLATAVAVIVSTTTVLVSYGDAAASAASIHKNAAKASSNTSSSFGGMQGMDSANPYMSPNVDPTWQYTGPEMPANEVSDLTNINAATDNGHVMQTPTCNAAPTMQQQMISLSLVQETTAAVAKYRDINAALADGYRPITDPNYPVVHYIKAGGSGQNGIIDPNHVPFLIYVTIPSGQKVLAAAMYMDPKGQGPMPGGCLTQWHAHNNLCLDPSKGYIDAFSPCPQGTRLVSTGFMFHVWQVPVPGGALALDPSDLQTVQAAIMEADGLSPYQKDPFNSAPAGVGGNSNMKSISGNSNGSSKSSGSSNSGGSGSSNSSAMPGMSF